MPVNKHALIRYQILDRCFRNTGKDYFFADLQQEIDRAFAEINPEGGGISRRQLLYDIKFMESSDGWEVPLERIRLGKKVLYRYSDPKFSINNQPLNQTELKQIEAALFILSRFRGLPQFEWISEIIPLLENKLGISGRSHQVIAYDSNIDYQGYHNIEPLFNAIINKQVLKIKYQDFKSNAPYDFIFHPYFLKQYNDRWFVFGKNENPPTELKDVEVWNLSLDRIQNIERTSGHYIDSFIDWEEYFEDMIGVTKTSGKKPEDINLRFDASSARYVATKPLHQTQKQTWLENGELEVIITVIPNYELESLILSFGEQVQVMEPGWLAARISTRIREACNKIHPSA
jgi:predicted DNA-binding transcriptional regulator YafY